ncbi:GPI-N-acetylgalactosamine transferase PGAP4-like [Glandiceps talaboti]
MNGRSLPHVQIDDLETPFLAVGVPTVKRTVKRDEYIFFQPKYVLEVVARMHQLIMRAGPDINSRIAFTVCNLNSDPDEHDEATILSKHVHVLSRNATEEKREVSQSYTKHEKQKDDYGFCMQEMSKLNANYTLILEDDALPHWDFFEVLYHILETKIEPRYGNMVNNSMDNLAYIKLYFPEKFQGFSWECEHLMELLSLGCIGGISFACTYIFTTRKRGKWVIPYVFGICIIYSILVAMAIGRQNLLRIREFFPHQYVLRDAPRCCCPAVLYSRSNIDKIVRFLQSPDLTCNRSYPMVVAIADYIQSLGLEAYRIEPNIVDHIGHFSSLKATPKDPNTYFRI